MGILKAAIGYGIGLAVLGIVLRHAVRGYLTVRRDKVVKLARRDSGRRDLSASSHYERTFLGDAVRPARPAHFPAPADPSGPYDQASERVDA